MEALFKKYKSSGKITEKSLTFPTPLKIKWKDSEETEIYVNLPMLSHFSSYIHKLLTETTGVNITLHGTVDVWQFIMTYCISGDTGTINSIRRDILIYVLDYLLFPKEIILNFVKLFIKSSHVNEYEKDWHMVPVDYLTEFEHNLFSPKEYFPSRASEFPDLADILKYKGNDYFASRLMINPLVAFVMKQLDSNTELMIYRTAFASLKDKSAYYIEYDNSD